MNLQPLLSKSISLVKNDFWIKDTQTNLAVFSSKALTKGKHVILFTLNQMQLNNLDFITKLFFNFDKTLNKKHKT